MTKCDVCYGTPGKYPVIDRFGRQLYEIGCPECGGDGEKPDGPVFSGPDKNIGPPHWGKTTQGE